MVFGLSVRTGSHSTDFYGRLACVGAVFGLVFGPTAFPRGSIVARSIDTVSCTPSMSIVTVNGVAERIRKGPSDFEISFGGNFGCELYGAAAFFRRLVGFVLSGEERAGRILEQLIYVSVRQSSGLI